MNLSDLNLLTAAPLSRPATNTATVTGSGFDLQPYEGVLKVVQEVGTVSGTTPTLDGKIQDSADNSTFADVSGLAFTEVTASNNSQSLQVDTRSVRRYIRFVGTIGGTTPSFAMAVEIFGGKKRLGSL